MMQIAEALKQARQQLAASDSAQIDAEILLCHCLQCDRSRIYAWPEQELPGNVDQAFFELVQKRAVGHPVAHLIASREFWSMRLQVTTDTLIPRPETECLVEAALALIPAEQSRSVLDLGTGSGAIALAIASERTRARIVATDISDAALQVARANADKLEINSVSFIQADWFSFDTDARFDVIVSNPPYISPDDAHLRQGDVRFETKTALVADDNGLADLQHIIKQSKAYLATNGWLLVEHGYQQAAAVRESFDALGYSQVSTGQDYAGRDRFSMGQKAQ